MEPGPKESESEGKKSTSGAGRNMNDTPEFKIPIPIKPRSEEKKSTGLNMKNIPDYKIPLIIRRRSGEKKSAGRNMNDTSEFKIPIKSGSEDKKLTSVAGRDMEETPEFKIPIKYGSEDKKLTSVAGSNMHMTPEYKTLVPMKPGSEAFKLTLFTSPNMNEIPDYKIRFPIQFGCDEKKLTSVAEPNMNETPELKIPIPIKSLNEEKKLAGSNMNDTPEFKIPIPIKPKSEEKKLTSGAGRNMNDTPEFKIPIPIKPRSEEKKSTGLNMKNIPDYKIPIIIRRRSGAKKSAGCNMNKTPEFKVPIPIKPRSEEIKLASVAKPPMNVIPTLTIPSPIESESEEKKSSVPVRAINLTPEDIPPEGNQGVTKLLLLEGHGGKPGYGDKVAIRFDSNLLSEGNVLVREREVHASFVIGNVLEGNILIGMDLAVATMTKGEMSTFIIGHPLYYSAESKKHLLPLKTQLVYNIVLLGWEPGDSSQKNEGGIVRQVPALNEMATFNYGNSNLFTMEWLGCQLGDKKANVSDITPEQNRGVIKELLKEGEGVMPRYGDTVVIRYDHSLIVHGALIPKSEKVEVSFYIGKDENILKGMDLAVTTMKKGEISIFIIRDEPYNLAKTKESEAPRDTQIVFKIEMLECQLEDLTAKKDGGILRKVILKGEDDVYPNEGSKVTIHLRGKVNGKVFENGVKVFYLGEGSCHGIPHGLEIVLYKLKRNAKSVVYLNDKHGILNGISDIDIPPQTPVSYEVIMILFKRTKEVWEMNTDEKYIKAKFSRERGVEFVSAKNYKIALMHFRWIIRCLEDEPGVDVKTVHLRNDLLQSGYLNMALCLLKLGDAYETIKFCNKALQLHPDNEKALFRRGMANIHNKNFEDALRDFNRITYLYPDNEFAKKCSVHCQEGINVQQQEAQNTYNRMFDKFVQQDEARAKKIKTETGVWDNEAAEGNEAEKQHFLNETERLLQENDSVLQDANVIELSSNLCGKF